MKILGALLDIGWLFTLVVLVLLLAFWEERKAHPAVVLFAGEEDDAAGPAVRERYDAAGREAPGAPVPRRRD